MFAPRMHPLMLGLAVLLTLAGMEPRMWVSRIVRTKRHTTENARQESLQKVVCWTSMPEWAGAPHK
jgi:hypothetical protein